MKVDCSKRFSFLYQERVLVQNFKLKHSDHQKIYTLSGKILYNERFS